MRGARGCEVREAARCERAAPAMGAIEAIDGGSCCERSAPVRSAIALMDGEGHVMAESGRRCNLTLGGWKCGCG